MEANSLEVMQNSAKNLRYVLSIGDHTTHSHKVR